ncbi:GAF and ANTAR domain-containing protein [Streptomyces sp. AN091965]|uniref:GAF and ANTAR domain-containing protein n=1 Tax=Streptomyces sp. AN091965 TaxID=2927803 RepID=UPI001F61958F|nr:GAF and ANTAR domain-containing protein [Streptomyces sp. AN091965]MCI3931835.1 GAF and ANTAR domain-containing protein [Streptomyces sp. AN091965]
MTMSQQRLAEAFVELAGGAPGDPVDPSALLAALAARGSELLGARACAVLGEPSESGEAQVYASETAARDLALGVHQEDEGPGAYCRETGRPVPRTDLENPVVRLRWPHYVPRALALGYTHVAARPLRGRERTVGALVLLGSPEEPVTDEGLAIGQSLADIVATALLREDELRRSHTLAGQLQHALTSRLVIEQAKGILAASRALTMDEAFALLRGYARSHQRKLAGVARDVVEGRLDP